MRRSILASLGSCLTVPLLFAHCSNPPPADPDSNKGSGGSSGRAATGGTAGGSSAAGGTGGSTGGASATGGTGGSTGGTTGGAPPTAGIGGAVSSGGVSATGGTTAGSGAGTIGGAGVGGANTAGSGAGPVGGAFSSGGGPAAGGPNLDENGIGLAKPGDQKTGSREYLRLGDLRMLNNKWGSDELGCNGTTMRIFVNADRTVGWDFNRPTCGGAGAKPDYPEIEFGVHPFGKGNVLETSPPFSSTKLLPLQIKDIMSASVNVENLHIGLQGQKSWNINFEFWLSQRNPLTDANPGVYAELIVFWGWQDGRWPCDMSGDVSAGDKSYHLCHQDDNWADGRWRYYQFWVNGGPLRDFSGKVDVKALLNYLVTQRGYSTDLWVTRFEVGSEIDDQTSGTVTLKNLTFEVNNVSKSIELGQ